MKYHKDEKMRGRMLKDTRNGMLWPWTEGLSKLPHMELIDETPKEPEPEYTSNGYKKPDFSEVLAQIKSKKVKKDKIAGVDVIEQDVNPDDEVTEEDDDIKGTDNAIS